MDTSAGTDADDQAEGVSADGLGNVYISGWTLGSLEGINSGDQDAFLVNAPEPAANLLIIVGTVVGLLRFRGSFGQRHRI